MTNIESQNAIADALGGKEETTPTIYGAQAATPLVLDDSGFSAAASANLAEFGAMLTDETAALAAQEVPRKAAEAASACVWLGLVAAAKRAHLDARGGTRDRGAHESTFETWCSRVFPVITTRALRNYMALARGFAADYEATCGDALPRDLGTENVRMLVDVWCGERTMAQIRRDLAAEARTRGLSAAEYEPPASIPPPPEEDEATQLLLKLDAILERTHERDEEVISAFDAAAHKMPPAKTQEYLHALVLHYGKMYKHYTALARKASEAASAAGLTPVTAPAENGEPADA